MARVSFKEQKSIKRGQIRARTMDIAQSHYMENGDSMLTDSELRIFNEMNAKLSNGGKSALREYLRDNYSRRQRRNGIKSMAKELVEARKTAEQEYGEWLYKQKLNRQYQKIEKKLEGLDPEEDKEKIERLKDKQKLIKERHEALVQMQEKRKEQDGDFRNEVKSNTKEENVRDDSFVDGKDDLTATFINDTFGKALRMYGIHYAVEQSMTSGGFVISGKIGDKLDFTISGPEIKSTDDMAAYYSEELAKQHGLSSEKPFTYTCTYKDGKVAKTNELSVKDIVYLLDSNIRESLGKEAVLNGAENTEALTNAQKQTISDFISNETTSLSTEERKDVADKLAKHYKENVNDRIKNGEPIRPFEKESYNMTAETLRLANELTSLHAEGAENLNVDQAIEIAKTLAENKWLNNQDKSIILAAAELYLSEDRKTLDIEAFKESIRKNTDKFTTNHKMEVYREAGFSKEETNLLKQMHSITGKEHLLADRELDASMMQTLVNDALKMRRDGLSLDEIESQIKESKKILLGDRPFDKEAISTEKETEKNVGKGHEEKNINNKEPKLSSEERFFQNKSQELQKLSTKLFHIGKDDGKLDNFKTAFAPKKLDSKATLEYIDKLKGNIDYLVKNVSEEQKQSITGKIDSINKNLDRISEAVRDYELVYKDLDAAQQELKSIRDERVNGGELDQNENGKNTFVDKKADIESRKETVRSLNEIKENLQNIKPLTEQHQEIININVRHVEAELSIQEELLKNAEKRLEQEAEKSRQEQVEPEQSSAEQNADNEPEQNEVKEPEQNVQEPQLFVEEQRDYFFEQSNLLKDANLESDVKIVIPDNEIVTKEDVMGSIEQCRKEIENDVELSDAERNYYLSELRDMEDIANKLPTRDVLNQINLSQESKEQAQDDVTPALSPEQQINNFTMYSELLKENNLNHDTQIYIPDYEIIAQEDVKDSIEQYRKEIKEDKELPDAERNYYLVELREIEGIANKLPTQEELNQLGIQRPSAFDEPDVSEEPEQSNLEPDVQISPETLEAIDKDLIKAVLEQNGIDPESERAEEMVDYVLENGWPEQDPEPAEISTDERVDETLKDFEEPEAEPATSYTDEKVDEALKDFETPESKVPQPESNYDDIRDLMGAYSSKEKDTRGDFDEYVEEQVENYDKDHEKEIEAGSHEADEPKLEDEDLGVSFQDARFS